MIEGQPTEKHEGGFSPLVVNRSILLDRSLTLVNSLRRESLPTVLVVNVGDDPNRRPYYEFDTKVLYSLTRKASFSFYMDLVMEGETDTAEDIVAQHMRRNGVIHPSDLQ